MKIVYNNIIPFQGYKAVNIFGILFVRKKYEGKLSSVDINHEAIHSSQIGELFWIFFYLWYFIEWIFRCFQYNFSHEAYRNVSFEREAYAQENNLEYLKTRKPYSFIKYLKK